MQPDKILIKRAHIVDPLSPHNGAVKDILIQNDIIKIIADEHTDADAHVVEADNLHISPGWFDLRVNFCDPGHEEKEDIESGTNAAVFGGFTAVGLSPETNPPLDSKASIEYVYQAADGPVDVYPYGALSRGLEGKEISEMYDMYQAGAVAFTNGKEPVNNAALMRLALQYGREFAPAVHVLAMEDTIAQGGQMHEGKVSTLIGLKGIPELAEELGITRDLYLANYAESSIHFMSLSSSSALGILRNAKKAGADFTADVALSNLFYTDEDLKSYDTNLKTLPPIRSQKDQDELKKALKDDIIQVITSDHSPQNEENKRLEFDNASWGMIGLESFFGAVNSSCGDVLNLTGIIEKIAINPRKVLNLEVPVIKEGEMAEITFFDPDEEWTFDKEHIQSKSLNTPFIGRKLKGRALGIFNNSTLVWLRS